MIKTNTFDVLVVYTQSVATSASHIDAYNITPFSLTPGREHYSQAYAYFLRKCRNANLRAAFTTSSDIVGPGTCKSYWMYKNGRWSKSKELCYAPLIFDKISPLGNNLRKKRNLLFSNGVAQPFNDPDLLVLFNDKLKTFRKLKKLTIPTVAITLSTIVKSIAKLNKITVNHANKNDFSTSYVLKDRFGAGGIHIYKLDTNPIGKITKIMTDTPEISFILQPFTKFDQGYGHKNIKGYTDIRIIYAQGEIIQRYVRTAQEKDFRCNEHQGGKVLYINEKAIPTSITNASKKILKILNKNKALFALDFIISNSGNAYFLEGNIKPGIYWSNSAADRTNTKALINVIVQELKVRTENYTFKTRPISTIDISTFIPSAPISKVPIVA